jgi:hypothetical protein
MKKLQLVAALAALGAAAPAVAYDSPLLVENVTFHWATDGLARGWTSSAPNSLSSISNDTFFRDLSGNNSTSYYNADFAQAGGAGWCPAGQEAFQAQYACRTLAQASPISGVGPGAKATGTLTVTSTSLTGTLTVIDTNDEGKGPQAIGLVSGVGNQPLTAATGYNIRSADGSPFVNVWYGISNQMTLTVNLTGSFSPTNWEINGGTVAFADPGFQCAIADFAGVLCLPSTTAGGFQANGSMLAWGMNNVSGAGTIGETPVFDVTGANRLGSIAGVLASLTVDAHGNLTTIKGETRNGSALGACQGQIRYNSANSSISCGTLTVRTLEITGKVVPVPAAAWLFGSALGLLGVARRKLVA